jgi:hypothetical protein
MRRTFSRISQIAAHIVWVLILLNPLHGAAQRRIRNEPARKPVASTANYHFTSGTSALGIPFQVSNNLVLVELRFNNSRPGWFLFSTGSTSVIDTRTARELGLVIRSQEKSTANGTGINAGSTGGVSLALPGVKTLNQIVGVLPLDFLFIGTGPTRRWNHRIRFHQSICDRG